MQIAALVPRGREAGLLRALSREHEVCLLSTCRELLEVIAAGQCHIALVDPLGLREDSFRGLVDALTARDTGLIVWAEPNRHVVRCILLAQSVIPVEVLFQACGEEPAILRALLRSGSSVSAAALLSNRIAAKVARLPHELQCAIVALFGGAPVPTSVESFAQVTRWHIRTVQRQLSDCGIGAPSTLLQVARTVRAWEPLAARTIALREIAAVACLSSAQALSDHFASCVGVPPRRASRNLSLEQFVTLLVDRLEGAKPKAGSFTHASREA